MAPDIPFFPEEGENPFLGRIPYGGRNPCTCKDEWDEQRRQEHIHAIASEVHDILAEHGLEAMVAQAVNEAIHRLGHDLSRPRNDPNVYLKRCVKGVGSRVRPW